MKTFILLILVTFGSLSASAAQNCTVNVKFGEITYKKVGFFSTCGGGVVKEIDGKKVAMEDFDTRTYQVTNEANEVLFEDSCKTCRTGGGPLTARQKRCMRIKKSAEAFAEKNCASTENKISQYAY
jgi:hypothetical protein